MFTAERVWVWSYDELDLDLPASFDDCAQFSFIEECKRNGKFSFFEFLDAVVQHEPKSFKNHFANPQVSKLFHVFLTEKIKFLSIITLHEKYIYLPV